MPCVTHDPGPSPQEIQERNDARITKGIACATLNFIAKMYEGNPNPLDSFLNNVDWKELGITKKEAVTWWKRHQKEDAARKAKEKAEAERRLLAAAEKSAKDAAALRKVVSTLSDAELASLGLTRTTEPYG
jgi:hypothetical protein